MVINELWIQLLYYFVCILDSTKSAHSEEQVLKSIDHLQRVFMEKSNLFNEVKLKLNQLFLKLFNIKIKICILLLNFHVDLCFKNNTKAILW